MRIRVDSRSFARTTLGTKRVPSVLELLVAGGKGKGGRETAAAAGKIAAVNAAAGAGSEQCHGAPNLYAEGVENLKFKANRGGGLEIVYAPEGLGNGFGEQAEESGMLKTPSDPGESGRGARVRNSIVHATVSREIIDWSASRPVRRHIGRGQSVPRPQRRKKVQWSI